MTPSQQAIFDEYFRQHQEIGADIDADTALRILMMMQIMVNLKKALYEN